MELRQIRYFQCVAAELSFTKAAARLHMAQPPLSRQIRQLEVELGVDLFDRLGRSIRLTDAGRFFLDQMTQLTNRLDDITATTKRIAENQKKWFGIGFVPSTLYGFVPDFIRQTMALNEQAEIGLLEMTTVQQFEALKAGRIDLGVGRILLNDPQIERLVLVEEPLMVVVAKTHPLAARPALRLEDILSESFILYPSKPRPSYADHVLKLFERHGHTPNVALETNELQTAVGLVAVGLGITLVPSSVHRLHRADITYIRLDAPTFTSPIMMSWLKSNESAFLKRVISQAKKSALDYYAG